VKKKRWSREKANKKAYDRENSKEEGGNSKKFTLEKGRKVLWSVLAEKKRDRFTRKRGLPLQEKGEICAPGTPGGGERLERKERKGGKKVGVPVVFS